MQTAAEILESLEETIRFPQSDSIDLWTETVRGDIDKLIASLNEAKGKITKQAAGTDQPIYDEESDTMVGSEGFDELKTFALNELGI
jgi:hypothetical protein